MEHNKIRVVDNYYEVDSRNRDLFVDCGIVNEAEKRHTCVVCGNRVSINDSYSDRGHNLICGYCYYDEKLFSSRDEAHKWINEVKK